MSVAVTPDPPDLPNHWKQVDALQTQIRALQAENGQSKSAVQQQWWAEVRRDFALSPDHITLLKHMRFELVEGTDLACIAVDGKRPFGNGDWVEDIYDTLGWDAEFDRDGMTEATIDRAQRIMAQLPLALNTIIEGLP